MLDIKERIIKILESTHLMSLATLDESGVWVSDVIFVFDNDLKIYWMSDPDCRHSQAILKNNKVAGTITQTTKSGSPNFGIQFSGNAEKIEGPRYDLACKHYEKRGKTKPEENDDVLEGDSWYKITPTKIDLIDEENLGFEKKSLDL
jgi:uncharacterized protein YhbP (UPF0306 family)